MTTRSPTARSEIFAGLFSFASAVFAGFSVTCKRYTVDATSFTSTDFPSFVFTTTESGLIFSTVPRTCTLFPCAKMLPAANTSNTAIVTARNFIYPSQENNRQHRAASFHVMILQFRFGLWRRSVQKIVFFLLFGTVVRPFGIVPLHLGAFLCG